MSLSFSIFSSGFFRDSRGVMEEFNVFEVVVENGAGFLRGRYFFNSNNNFSGWLNRRGFLFSFNSRAVVAFAYKFSYLGRVVREIVETERMYV